MQESTTGTDLNMEENGVIDKLFVSYVMDIATDSQIDLQMLESVVPVLATQVLKDKRSREGFQ